MAIIAFSGGETGQIFDGGVGEDHWGWEVLAEPYRSEAIKVVTNPVRAGNYAIRIFWDWPEWPNFTTQPDKQKIRTELKRPNNMPDFTAGNEYWMGYSVFLADTANNHAAYNSGYTNQSITQLHQRNGTATSQLMARNGQWEISCPTGPKQYLGAITYGVWNDFVIYWKAETNNTGIFRVWLNASSSSDTPVYNQTNRSTIWSTGSYFKIGIYRQWVDIPGVSYFEQFYDEIRIGNSAESFDSIKPESAGGFNLGAEDISSASEVTSPSIAQVHNILADDVSATTEVSVPTLGQAGVQVLLAEDVESASTVSSPLFYENEVPNPISLVNVTAVGGDTTVAATATVNVSASAGNLLTAVLVLRNGQSYTIDSVSAGWDEKHLYDSTVNSTDAAVAAALWTRFATGDASDDITVTWSTNRRYILIVAEWEGFSSLEDTAIQLPGNVLLTNTSVGTGTATAASTYGGYVVIAALRNRDTETSLATAFVDYEYDFDLADDNIAGVNFGHYNYSTTGDKSDTWSFADNNAVGFLVLGAREPLNIMFADDVEATSEVSTPTLTSSGAIRLYPDGDSSVGNWRTDDNSTSNLYQAIDESAEDDNDYVKSELLPSSSAVKFSLSNPASTPASSDNHVISYRYGKGNGSANQVDLTVKLIQGASTVIATWVHTDIGATITEASQVLSGAQVASITDYDDLFIEFTANAP